MTCLTGKRIIVTGGGTGIGQGIAVRLAREGARVCFSYHASAKGAEETLRQIALHGGQASAFPANLQRMEEGVKMVEQAVEEMGGLDALVCNAGPTITRPFLEVTPADWDCMHHIHLRTAFFCAQAAVRSMQATGRGRLIFIGSVHGRASAPLFGPYAAAKGGLEGLTRQLAIELAPLKITVNCVAPGLVEVESYFRDYPEYRREEAARQVPIGRVGFPDDIAPMVAFLITAQTDFLTGQTIPIDGGQLARLSLLRADE
ncbi:MAG: SDR family oxidoreductase [Opitutales bacterium]|nr:SDR family oxidoreductase [Opitutales bacterium]